MEKGSFYLPLERTVLIVCSFMFFERFLTVEELVTALVGAREKHLQSGSS
jgi:hypothetical protein